MLVFAFMFCFWCCKKNFLLNQCRLYHVPINPTLKPIIHGIFLMQKPLGGKLAIGWQVDASVCQPIANRPSCGFRIRLKTLRVVSLIEKTSQKCLTMRVMQSPFSASQKCYSNIKTTKICMDISCFCIPQKIWCK